MMQSSEGTGFVTRFGVLRRRMSMRRIVTTSAFCLAALVILVGCGRVRYPKYYTLNLPAPPDPPPAENVHAAVAIREFSAPSYLRQGAIVYKTCRGERFLCRARPASHRKFGPKSLTVQGAVAAFASRQTNDHAGSLLEEAPWQ